MTACPKNPAYRSLKWRSYVNTRMPCVLQGTLPAVAAHISWNSGRGIAYKADDYRIVPLNPVLHVLQGNMPEGEFWVEHIKKSIRFFGQVVAIWLKSNHGPFQSDSEDHVMNGIILWARNEHNVWQKTGSALWL